MPPMAIATTMPSNRKIELVSKNLWLGRENPDELDMFPSYSAGASWGDASGAAATAGEASVL